MDSGKKMKVLVISAESFCIFSYQVLIPQKGEQNKCIKEPSELIVLKSSKEVATEA